jgi:hypothetical protein
MEVVESLFDAVISPEENWGRGDVARSINGLRDIRT